MLSNENNEKLHLKKIDIEFMFFYQRWREMLDNRTLDMYKYDILNSCVACVHPFMRF